MEVAGGSHCRTFVHAADPGAAILGLRFAPGMFRFRSGEADRLRVQDLRSERERQALQAAAADPTEYLRSLGVSLTFRVDQPSDLPRAAELSRKTNQFTTALARLDETQLAERMECGDARVVTVSLRDRLSDSGSIALIVGRLEGDTVLVEDVCMSCRAMGRGLESAIVLRAVDEITTSLGRHRVVFDVTDGPRNAPARSWLAGVTDDTARFDRRPPVDEDDPVNVEWVR